MTSTVAVLYGSYVTCPIAITCDSSGISAFDVASVAGIIDVRTIFLDSNDAARTIVAFNRPLRGAVPDDSFISC